MARILHRYEVFPFRFKFSFLVESVRLPCLFQGHHPAHATACGDLPGHRYEPSGDCVFNAVPLEAHGIRSRMEGYYSFQRSFSNHLSSSSAISLKALIARSTSSKVLKYEKLNLTAPCAAVPRALCMRGAQCAPGLVAMP